MTAKHTPGPWFTVPTLTGAVSINKTAQVPIATVGGAGWHLGREMAEANAALIASAPDLLAERDRLRAVNADLLRALILVTDLCGAAGVPLGEAGHIARAAIAKATTT